MGYKVIHYFEDLQDFNHQYKVGDIFPRLGMVVTDARLKELSSKNNKQGKPLIEKIEEKEPLEGGWGSSSVGPLLPSCAGLLSVL